MSDELMQESEDKIIFFQFPRDETSPRCPNISAFCVKLESFLRWSKLPYRTVESFDFKGSPYHQYPYILVNRAYDADSTDVIAHLNTKHSLHLDERLTNEQKGIATAFQRVIENHLYPGVVYERWCTDEGWKTSKPALFGTLPPVIRDLVAWSTRRGIRNSLKGHGLGRLEFEKVSERVKKDIQGLSAQLGDKTYLIDDRICTVDFSLMGLLLAVLYTDHSPIITSMLKEHPNLVAYAERALKNLYPEYAKSSNAKAQSDQAGIEKPEDIDKGKDE